MGDADRGVPVWRGLERQYASLSARHRFDTLQRRSLWTTLAVILIAAAVVPATLLLTINLLFALYCAAVLALRVCLFALSVKADRAPPHLSRQPDPSLPMVTVLIAMYREKDSARGLVAALSALDYPPDRLDIQFLLEADDRETHDALARYAHGPQFRLHVVPEDGPRTKPKALCYGLAEAKGSFLAVYDAEDIPQPDQLRRAIATFAQSPPEVACLQAQLNFHNRNDSVLTRLFAIEYALHFDLLLPGLHKLRMPLPLGGTSNIFRVSALRAVGGWDPYNVTEDADLGLRLSAAGYTIGVVLSTTLEQAVQRPEAWVRQRSRWIKGFLQTWFVHVRGDAQAVSARHALALHLFVGGVVVAGLINPLFWLQYGLWLAGAPVVREAIPAWLGAFGIVSLLGGNLFHLWLAMLAPLRREWYDLVPYAVLSPVYWVLQSVAAVKCLADFCTRPHHWEKTDHSAGPLPDEIDPDLMRALT